MKFLVEDGGGEQAEKHDNRHLVDEIPERLENQPGKFGVAGQRLYVLAPDAVFQRLQNKAVPLEGKLIKGIAEKAHHRLHKQQKETDKPGKDEYPADRFPLFAESAFSHENIQPFPRTGASEWREPAFIDADKKNTLVRKRGGRPSAR